MTNYEPAPNALYKTLMAGLFTGIVIVIVNLIFSAIYRSITSFNLTMIINIVTINFFSVLISLIAGLFYYFIVHYSQKKKSLYTIIWIIIMAGLIIGGLNIHRSDDVKLTSQFHFFLTGILIITCLLEVFLIPYMSTHKNPVF